MPFAGCGVTHLMQEHATLCPGGHVVGEDDFAPRPVAEPDPLDGSPNTPESHEPEAELGEVGSTRRTEKGGSRPCQKV